MEFDVNEYVFTYIENQSSRMEKKAGMWDFATSTLPAQLFLAPAGAGALWYAINRPRYVNEMKHKRRMDAINEGISDVERQFALRGKQ